jgi:MFS family permease
MTPTDTMNTAVSDGPASSASTVCDLKMKLEKEDAVPELERPPINRLTSIRRITSLTPSLNLARLPSAAEPLGIAAPDLEKAEAAPKDKAPISQARKWGLLAIFSLAMFIDIWMYSAFFIFTDVISVDLGIPFSQQAWVITSYSVTFAAFLLFWGRVSDLYSAKPVFAYGFTALGVLSLVISFLPDMYSFFVLRAIAGIAGSALIPSSYRLITEVFEAHELGRAFTLFGMSGALANVTGVIIAGVIDLIPLHGQGASWRWFFRVVAVIIIPFAVAALIYIPTRRGSDSDSETAKWKRLDLPGSVLMLGATILLVLGLTLGAAQGFKTAAFLVPFLLALVVLFPAFFIWEARIPEEMALLPPSFWRIPNTILLITFALQIYGWWGVNFLAHVETYMKVHHETGILAAVRVLPQGIAAFTVLLFLTFVPKLVSRPRWTVITGMVLAIVGYVLFVQNKNFVGADYWKYVFTGSIIGSAGMAACFTATNVALMTSVDPSVAGVAGAMLQVAFQIGSSVTFGAQAGLFTVNEGGLANYENVHASFYFQLGWMAIALISFIIFYRQPKTTGNVVVAAH